MAAKKKQKVGVIGLGNMGGGIARNLAKQGFETFVWDVSEEARKTFAKVGAVTEPSEMAAKCAVVIFAVPGSPEIAALLKGRSGMLAKARRGLVLCDFTTSEPVETKKLAGKAKAEGVAYLDAGMSGGAQHADKGTLTLMMGGDAKAAKKIKPVLDAIAAST
ncbi:MAG: NAD(P)-binding domain-containing protein, partial [Rhodospirillaceae bacterium]